jgi:hypothetical protein
MSEETLFWRKGTRHFSRAEAFAQARSLHAALTAFLEDAARYEAGIDTQHSLFHHVTALKRASQAPNKESVA